MISPIKAILIGIGAMSLIGADSNEHHLITKITSIQLAERLNTSDGKGFYAEILTAITKNNRFRMDIQIQPLKRSLVDFAERKADCIWPIDRNLIVKLIGESSDILESDYVFEASQHIFTAPGQPAISNLKELAGKLVGVTIGSNVEKELRDASALVDHVPLQDNKINMLMAGHLFAIIGWAPDFLITFHDLKLGSPQYDKSLVLTKTRNAFVCHKSPVTINFLKKMNPAIKAFRVSAQSKTIAEKYGVSQIFGHEDISN